VSDFQRRDDVLPVTIGDTGASFACLNLSDSNGYVWNRSTLRIGDRSDDGRLLGERAKGSKEKDYEESRNGTSLALSGLVATPKIVGIIWRLM
jgi:hypothetical protein